MKWVKVGDRYVNVELVAGVTRPGSNSATLMFSGGATMGLAGQDAANFLRWLDAQQPEDVSQDPAERRRLQTG